MRSALTFRTTAVAAMVVASLAIVGAQALRTTPSELAAQLRERYDIVLLDQGIALVPRQTGDIRLIQIVDGVVSIDGETVTGRQLRDRLGRDADVVLQVSYFDRDAQRQMSGAQPSGTLAPDVSTPTVESQPDAPREIERPELRDGDIVRFGGNVTVARNERVRGDVVVFGGSADVDGEITGDLAVIGGSARLGPDAVVRGDLNAIGGRLDRAAGARVFGSFNDIGSNSGVTFGNNPVGPFRRFPDLFGSFWSRVGSLAATLLRLGLVMLIGFVAVAVGSRPVERIAASAAASPIRSGLIGLAAEILFTPVLILTVIVLAVSIVGIPLLVLVPFAIVLLMVVMLVGFAGLSYQIGRVSLRRLGRPDENKYLAVAIGVLVIGGLTVLAKVGAVAGGRMIGIPIATLGYFMEYVAWTVGFGAAISAWYDTQTRFGSRNATMPLTPASSNPS